MPMRPLQPGEDPRKKIRRHRERGMKRWSFTYADIAKVCGISVGAVRKAASWRGKRPPRLDMTDIVSFASFLQDHGVPK